MKVFALLCIVAFAFAEEGPACESSERYNCAGSTVPVRDSEDCTKFYNCDANIQTPCPSYCPPGLLYNDVLKICDWPEQVSGCGPQPSFFMNEEEIEGPACLDEERYDCAGSTVPVRDDNDCTVFYNCDAQIQRPCPSTCPPGLYYNDVLKVCDWPSAVSGCESPFSKALSMDEEEVEGPACLDEERFDCAGSTVPVRDANDCSVFYNCDAQIQRPCPSSCPSGLLYNDVLKVCDWPSEVTGCVAPAVFSMDEEEGPACLDEERFDCAGTTTPVRDQDDCSVFYNCDSNIQHPCPSQCPAGLVFNQDLYLCDWPASVQC